MSLPPERISIKRRRHDDPVDTLYLEHTVSHEKKRRFTDFLFKREQSYLISSKALNSAGNKPYQGEGKHRAASNYTSPGIPSIRATRPGDEVQDLLKLKADHNARLRASERLEKQQAKNGIPALDDVPDGARSADNSAKPKIPKNARQFHLSREHAVLGPSKHHGGVRKSTHRAKSHLATFIEKHGGAMELKASPSSKAGIVDRIIEITDQTQAGASSNSSAPPEGIQNLSTKHTFAQPFVKLPNSGPKMGHTIHSHPATWDFDSEQLARELAAFAFELDPTGDDSEPGNGSQPANVATETLDIATEEDFVYETYIRLPHNAIPLSNVEESNLSANVGVLVISEEDEDLWETYADSDDNLEWDEEDADSNAEDNPANDYPEDEVSSDDEFGHGAYNHRKNASDDEEYDIKRGAEEDGEEL